MQCSYIAFSIQYLNSDVPEVSIILKTQNTNGKYPAARNHRLKASQTLHNLLHFLLLLAGNTHLLAPEYLYHYYAAIADHVGLHGCCAIQDQWNSLR